MHRLLVVGETAAEAHALAVRLGLAGFEAMASGPEVGLALRQLFSSQPQAIVLDCSPGDHQRELFRMLGTVSELPILVLSASNSEDEVVWYLEEGAADYIVKPISPTHLSARLQAVLRHAVPETPGGVLRVGEIELDLDRHEVRHDGSLVSLTPKEFDLLRVLAERPGQACSHRMLLERVWGGDFAFCTHYLRLYIGYLRRKLEDDPKKPRLLVTHWGVGYRLRDARRKGRLPLPQRARVAPA